MGTRGRMGAQRPRNRSPCEWVRELKDLDSDRSSEGHPGAHLTLSLTHWMRYLHPELRCPLLPPEYSAATLKLTSQGAGQCRLYRVGGGALAKYSFLANQCAKTELSQAIAPLGTEAADQCLSLQQPGLNTEWGVLAPGILCSIPAHPPASCKAPSFAPFLPPFRSQCYALSAPFVTFSLLP